MRTLHTCLLCTKSMLGRCTHGQCCTYGRHSVPHVFISAAKCIQSLHFVTSLKCGTHGYTFHSKLPFKPRSHHVDTFQCVPPYLYNFSCLLIKSLFEAPIHVLLLLFIESHTFILSFCPMALGPLHGKHLPIYPMVATIGPGLGPSYLYLRSNTLQNHKTLLELCNLSLELSKTYV